MNFTVYKSSAGSGKTYTLVKEYLKIVLRNPADFRTILAVTFTNKAANEMKERVISNLKELASPNPDTESKVIRYLFPDLLKETELNEHEIYENARKALALILHHYSDFSISTIDSFVYKIVKTFAYDLRLPLNFEVELEPKRLLNEAIDILISRVGMDDELTDFLLRFTESKTDDERDWNIEKDLFDLAETLLDEDGQMHISRLKTLTHQDFKNIAKELSRFIKDFLKQILEAATEAVIQINQQQLSFDSFYYGRSGIGNYFNKLSKLLSDDFYPNSRVVDTIENDVWYGSKIDDTTKNAIDQIKDQLRTVYQKIKSLLDDKFERYKLYKLLYQQIYPLAVLSEIEKIVSEIKEENNIVHISEFNRQISKIVFAEPVPFIYERLGEKYKHFLIDEFQDTSLLQWQNMIPLIDNSLAEGHFNMIVGDGKQAIYRWRNGEVEQFAHLPEIFHKENLPFFDERENNLKRNFIERKLKHNFRSKREIIEFNNDFFRLISEKLTDDFKGIYEGIEQMFDEQNTGGYVHLEFIPNQVETEEDLFLIRLKQLVDEILISGRRLGDIALLCRTKNEARVCTEFLMQNSIPVLSSETLLLSASDEINSILAFIKYLLNPRDRISLAAVLQFLINTGRVNEESLIEIFDRISKEDDEGLFFQDIRDYFYSNGFGFDSHHLLALPLYDLLEEIIRLFGFHKKLDPYLQFFMDAALKYSLRGKTNIKDFLDWWEVEKENESVVIPEGIDAIQVLTIHKSKGLEFPVVIYPFANEKVKRGLNNLWLNIYDENLSGLEIAYLPVNKSLSETIYKDKYDHEMNKSLLDFMNLLYVAFTRPIEQLYVLTSMPPEKSKSETVDISKMIKYFLEQKQLWKNDKLIYSFGEIINIDRTSQDSKDHYNIKEFYSVNWRDKLMISTTAPEIWDVEDPEQNKKRGNLIHFLLSKIISQDQIHEVILEYTERGIIERSVCVELEELIKKIISNSDIEPYFRKGLTVRTEASILLESGLTVRPDRLIINEQDVVILDYKTGKPTEKHKGQLDQYAKILQRMGYHKVEKVLIYIGDDILVRKWD